MVEDSPSEAVPFRGRITPNSGSGAAPPIGGGTHLAISGGSAFDIRSPCRPWYLHDPCNPRDSCNPCNPYDLRDSRNPCNPCNSYHSHRITATHLKVGSHYPTTRIGIEIGIHYFG